MTPILVHFFISNKEMHQSVHRIGIENTKKGIQRNWGSATLLSEIACFRPENEKNGPEIVAFCMPPSLLVMP